MVCETLPLSTAPFASLTVLSDSQHGLLAQFLEKQNLPQQLELRRPPGGPQGLWE